MEKTLVDTHTPETISVGTFFIDMRYRSEFVCFNHLPTFLRVIEQQEGVEQPESS